MNDLEKICADAYEARVKTGTLDTDIKNKVLNDAADNLLKAEKEILEANKRDVATAEENMKAKSMIDRLSLDHDRLLGMADGVHWNDNTDFAYHIGAAYSVYTKNANRWVIGGEYLHKKYDYKDMQIPVEQFTAEGGYYLKFLSDRRKTFFLSLGLSALAGYEVSNKSEKLLPDGSTLLDKDCFIYGGALTLELEAYLTDRVALLLNARERALFGSDIGKFHTQVSLGLKFIIN